MRYFGKVFAFILFVIALKFFNDGNMYWWFFMFGFIIVSGFLIGEENIEDEQVEAMLNPRFPSDWEEYKATYVEDEVNDGIIVDNIVNIDAEIKYKTDESDYNPRKEEMEDDIPF
jgi:hypothetical protein